MDYFKSINIPDSNDAFIKSSENLLLINKRRMEMEISRKKRISNKDFEDCKKNINLSILDGKKECVCFSSILTQTHIDFLTTKKYKVTYGRFKKYGMIGPFDSSDGYKVEWKNEK